MHIWLLLLFGLFLMEFLYIRLADKMNIIDKPNLRSSHSVPVVRGGGIIFPLAWIVFFISSGGMYPWFTIGLCILSFISFVDDIRPLSAGQRFVFHIISCTLLLTELSLWNQLPVWAVVLIFISVIGILNAFNFMDGINGMTGLYSLSIIIPIILNIAGAGDTLDIDPRTSPVMIIGASTLVFGFFNFRKKARCFAGDVGSISIGYILVFFIMSLIFSQNDVIGVRQENRFIPVDISYILMLSVYGVDTVLTILLRLKLRENIFEAHRRHLYQYLANEMKVPHLTVSIIYGLVQFLINIYVLSGALTWGSALIILGILSAIYLFFKKNDWKNTSE
jgi:UDP-GlcNAc:undecaprenyl-phosphate/decaprenyl-phosphate GlcNAc-1-phosphate transferase